MAAKLNLHPASDCNRVLATAWELAMFMVFLTRLWHALETGSVLVLVAALHYGTLHSCGGDLAWTPLDRR